jgi:hypothetical protein
VAATGPARTPQEKHAAYQSFDALGQGDREPARAGKRG